MINKTKVALTKDSVSYFIEVMFTMMVQLSLCGALNSSFSTRAFARHRRSQGAAVELPPANTTGPNEHVINYMKKSVMIQMK